MMLASSDISPGVVHLDELFVPTDYRGRGFGTLGLQWFLSLVDKHGYEVRSYVGPFGDDEGLGKKALAAWYKRHGFEIRRDYSMVYKAR
jgi:GNAT superfamily N-acetyltransferase